MKIHFKNANILTGLEIVHGDVIVDGDRIVYVGSNPPEGADREIDVKGNVLMSGFVNAHAHNPMTLLRGVSDDTCLDVWLEDNMFPLEQKLTPEDVYWGEMLGIAESVSAGITGFEECYFYPDKLIDAVKKSGIRCRLGLPGMFNDESIDEVISHIDAEILKLDGDLIRPVIYAHSTYTVGEEQLLSLVDYSAKHKLPMSLHLSETLKEVGEMTAELNQTPPEYLESIGVLDRDCTLYHCVHVDKDDMMLLTSYGANIVTCPSSNLKLGSGIAPVYSMTECGLNVAIGTDGAASNNSLDMFKEMFLVSTLSKGLLCDPSVLPAREVLKMATINGAKALGLENCGDIKEGYKADLILVNLNSPHQMPVNNIISNLVYSSKSSDVYFTMVNGKILYENGKFNIGEDIEEIYKNCQNIMKRVLG